MRKGETALTPDIERELNLTKDITLDVITLPFILFVLPVRFIIRRIRCGGQGP
jgi:hypothetical protein